MDQAREQVLDARVGRCVPVVGARQTTDSDSEEFGLVGVEKALHGQQAALELLENAGEFAWVAVAGRVECVGENLAQEIQRSAVLGETAVAMATLVTDGDTVVVEFAENIVWEYALGSAVALVLAVAGLASWLAPASQPLLLPDSSSSC